MAKPKYPLAPCVARFPSPSRLAPEWVDVSPDGTKAAVTGWGLHVIDLAGGAVAISIEHPQRVICWCARFTPDGERLVTAFGDLSFRVYDLASGRERVNVPTAGIATRISLSADGRYALCASANNTLQRFTVHDGALAGEHRFPKSWAVGAALHPSGLVAASAGTDGFLRRWDFDRGELVSCCEGKGWCDFVDVSSDGKWFATGGRGKAPLLFDADSGELVRAFAGFTRNIQKVALNADGSRVCAVGGKGPAIVWDTASGQIVCALPHDGAPACARFSKDGCRAVSVDAQTNAVCVFELPD